MKRIRRILSLLVIFIMLMMPVETPKAATVYTLSLSVQFKQTDARSMLSYVNAFRTGSDAWQLNESGQKVYVSGLGALTYDYTLEACAMQRAAEAALLFSHTRPDGNAWNTVFSEYSYSGGTRGENLAAGNTNAAATFEQWQETNRPYSGQGHRRNMLGTGFKAIGIAHAVYNGCDFWVMELGGAVQNTSATTANNSITTKSVKITSDYVSSSTATINGTSALSMKCGETVSLANQKVNFLLSAGDAGSTFTRTLDSTYANMTSSWSVSGSSVSISGTTLKAVTPGTATLTTNALGKTSTVSVTVAHNWVETGRIAASCLPGSISYKCSGCSATKSETLPAVKSHSYISTVNSSVPNQCKVSPDCKTTGVYYKYCSTCKSLSTETFTTSKDSSKHVGGTIIKNEAESTCTEYGYSGDTYCYGCNTQISSGTTLPLNPSRHMSISSKNENNIPATCETAGSYDFNEYCIYCRTLLNSTHYTIPAKGHAWNNGVITISPTCTTEGVKTFTCSNDSKHTKTETVAIDSNAHKYGSLNISATTHYCICEYNESHIASGDHTFGEWLVVKAPTEKETGLKVKTCSVCEYEVSELMDVLPHIHNFDEYRSNGDGTHTLICSGCKEAKPGYGVASCNGGTVSCTNKAICSICKSSYGELLAHEYGNNWICDNTGHWKKCNNCTAITNYSTHTLTTDKAVAATCTKSGLTEGKHCSVCDKVTIAQANIAALGHTYSKTTTKATTSANGSIVEKCSRCGLLKSSTTINKISSVTLAGTSYVYTGYEIKPAVTVKDSAGKTIANTNYTITYSANKAIGKATVTIKFKNNYNATVTKTFTIKPKTTTINSPVVATDGITVKWTKNTTGAGYKIYRSVNGATYSLVKTITNNTTVSWKDTGAKTNGNKYQYKIIAYKTVNGITYNSAYSSVKTSYFLTRPTVSLSNTDNGIKLSWSKNAKATGYYIYRSTDGTNFTKIKTITSNSTITYTDTASRTNAKKYIYKIIAYKTVSGTTYNSPYSAPKTYYYMNKPFLNKLSIYSNKLSAGWTKVSSVSGYQIQYSTSSSFSSAKTVTSAGTATTKDLGTVTAGKTYYVKVRAYKTVNNVKYYSAWSNSFSINNFFTFW